MLTICVCLFVCLFVYLEYTQYWDCVIRVTDQTGRKLFINIITGDARHALHTKCSTLYITV